MQISPYLTFDGTCEEAFRLYADLMGGEVLSIKYYPEGDGALRLPDGRMPVLAARLRLGDDTVIGTGDISPWTHNPMAGVRLQAQINDPIEAKRIFGKLCDGGQVEMPFEPTYWAEGFGICRDRFGVRWMVNCARESDDRADKLRAVNY